MKDQGFRYDYTTDTVSVEASELQQLLMAMQKRIDNLERNSKTMQRYCECGDAKLNVRHGVFVYSVCCKCDLIDKS